jgi:hypothetical protein
MLAKQVRDSALRASSSGNSEECQCVEEGIYYLEEGLNGGVSRPFCLNGKPCYARVMNNTHRLSLQYVQPCCFPREL